ncbi:MAG: aminotransferase class IV [Phycisphaeraceae bacterium]|nr:MAG: aminotransferase class IV [Phycisphaeraceae bacterium]
MATVFLNGRFVDRASAVVSAFDAGYQHGVGLFETMTAVARRSGESPEVVGLWEHLERLKGSALSLGLASTLRTAALGEAVGRVVARAAEEHRDTERFRVRLTISGGDLNLLDRGGGGGVGHEPTLVIVAQPATVYPAEMYVRGARVVIADVRVNPLDPMAGHKTLNYWGRLRELQSAASKGAGEALVFQVTNHVSGGAVSNVFVVKGGVVRTPIARGEEAEVAGSVGAEVAGGEGSGRGAAVMPSPVLPGVTRRWVMESAGSMGLEVERRMLTIDDVLSSDEVFLTNSSWGVMPVVGVERHEVGGGAVGPVAADLVSRWGRVMSGE